VKYRFADCELDTKARTLQVGGKPVHVERQVYEILVLLLENAGRAVSRDLLLARIWGGRIVSESAIASRINATRRAVGDDGRRQAVIVTESRFGFRLVAEVAVEGGTAGRPVIAVLPLEVIGGDTDDVRLARGIADQLAGMLGYASHVDVIDTAASFAPALAALDPARIGVALSARYLVTGTLMLSGAAMRAQIRLVEAEQGRQVWARTFDGTRDQVFDLQDRLVAAVLAELEPHLVRHEVQQSRSRHGTARAFDHYLRAADLLRVMDRKTIEQARAELDTAISQFPNYAAAHAMKAWIATMMVPNGLEVDPDRELAGARRSLALGVLDCDALSMGGYAYAFFSRDLDAGIGYLTSALALNPSSARANDHVGWLLLYCGRSTEAASHFDRAVALCPLDEFNFRMLTGRAFASLFGRDFASSLAFARRARTASPGYTICHRVLIASLAHLGRVAEARAVAEDLLVINPGFTIAKYEEETRFTAAADRDILFSGLVMAGLR
jgi:DNA-binding winged helix-turn-helix (wHTH) protein/tetratricopeptide (TPR) repeat protein